MTESTPESRTGWRVWLLDRERAELLPPYASLGPHAIRDAWLPGTNLARCADQPHRAPAEGCECGLRAMDDLGALLKATDLRHLADTRMGREWFTGRWTAEDLGAVGEVKLWGRFAPPSDNDPAGTWRAPYAEALRVYLVPSAGRAVADRLAARLHVPVMLGLPVV